MPISDETATDLAAELQRSVPRLLESLRVNCRPQTLERGRAYEAEDRVRLLEVSPDRVRAEVIGTDDAPYTVTLELDKALPASSCTCPAWGSYDDHCKHVAAVAFGLQKAARGDRPRAPLAAWLPPVALRPDQAPAAAPEAADVGEVREWLGLPLQSPSFAYDLELGAPLSLGVLRLDATRPAARGRFVQISHYLAGRTLDPLDRRAFAALEAAPRTPDGRHLVSPAVAGAVIEALRGRRLTHAGRTLGFADLPSHLFGEVSLADGRRTITLRLRLGDGSLAPLEGARFLSQSPPYALVGATLHRVDCGASLDQLERWRRESEIELPADSGAALEFAMSGLRRLGVIFEATGEVAPLAPTFVLTLDGDAETVRAALAVRYADVELPLTFAGPTTHVTADGRLLHRDAESERGAVEALLAAGLSHGAGGGAFGARGDRAIEFWSRGVLDLPRDWVFYGPQPKDVVRLRQLAPRVALTQAKGGWFTLEVAFAETDQSIDLAKLRPLLAAGRRYVPLSDGSVGELPREIAEYVKGLLEETGAEPEGGAVELAPFEGAEVERLIGLVPDARVAPEARRFLAALRDFHGIDEVEVPRGLKAELRPYQQRGLDWLAFLHRHGMSGVLADDMGLGKTVQALALLLWAKKEDGRAPSLVVAPTSVLPNWQREAERFSPSLKVLAYDGPDRQKRVSQLGAADLVLTSYAILRRDAEALRKHKFRYVILDEAQHVKNPGSLGARAARSLQSAHRLALTGTPMENRLSDLWSLFHFLMPGLLGSEQQFQKRYARPIEVDGNSGQRDRLRRRVHPFMLRRLKDEVARDLPPKTETVLPVDLSPGQQALYREMLLTAKSRVDSIIGQVGFKRARISILTELLRLRQVCCDPRLLKLPPGTRLPPSAKLEAFGELLRDIIDEGHRVLVFSQFVEMLGHLRALAEEDGLPYEYLDGSTPDRQERIDRFNAKDGPPIFFLSLKAGGTGLNLTAADYVIHYDPWWNPAVEQQAVDRTHRIGQTKPVFSYKLITKGTVEEKIVAMQSRKKDLANSVLSDDDAVGKILTEKDVEELFRE